MNETKCNAKILELFFFLVEMPLASVRINEGKEITLVNQEKHEHIIDFYSNKDKLIRIVKFILDTHEINQLSIEVMTHEELNLLGVSSIDYLTNKEKFPMEKKSIVSKTSKDNYLKEIDAIKKLQKKLLK